MACGGGRRLSEGERCKHPLEESLRAAAAPADRGPMGAPKHPASEPWVRLSAVLVNPYSLSPADLALLFSSHRLLKLTAADDGFLCSVHEKH